MCAIVDLTQSWEQRIDIHIFATEEIVRLNLPTPDYSCPSVSALTLAVNFIEQHRTRG